MTTKTQLLAAFEREMKARYGWTQDEDKLASFMKLARFTLNTGATRVDLANDAFYTALTSVGLPINTPLRELVELPD